MSTLEKLEIEIAEKIKDYRKNELSIVLDDKHVDTWVKQFQEDERFPILQETNNLLDHCYFDCNTIETFFEEIWNAPFIWGTNPYDNVNKIQFLNIQTKGTSQNLLLKLLNSYYQKHKSISINLNNSESVNKYIYIDDCMYTGETMRHNLMQWFYSSAPNINSELDIILLAFYTGNYDYNLNTLNDVIANLN